MIASELSAPLILMVDDTRRYRLLVHEYLKRAGYRVAEADSGEGALLAAKAEAPDLILLDLNMPGIGGLETCRRLKADPDTRDIPMLFFLASGQVGDIVNGFEVGASDYLTKRAQTAELLARVRSHVRLKQLQDERLRL